jgi:hypothetical protein
MITTLANSLVAAFNRAQPGSLPSMFSYIGLGTQLRQKLPVTARNVVPTTDPWAAASNVSVILPDDCKAQTILAAYARTGTGTAGPLTVVASGPTAGQCCVSPDGNILFYATDAWTLVDISYQPVSQDCVEVTLPCVSGVVTLPAGTLAPYVINGVAQAGGAITLMEAQRADTSTAQLLVAAPAATNSTTGSAHFNLAKTTVLLDSTDGATSVRVKIGIVNKVDLNALLEAQDNNFI